MIGSVSSIISGGLGSWSSSGLVLTLGFGVGEAAAVAFVAPQLTISRLHAGTLTVGRMNAGTLNIARINAGTVEVSQ